MNRLLADTWWMAHRRLKSGLRQPVYPVTAVLVQPAIWLFLFGGLFRAIAKLPGWGSGSYLDYLVPGIVVMSAFSSSMWSGMAAVEEIDRGTLNRLLATPVSRSAIVNGTVVEHAISTTAQSLVIVLLGLAAGARYPGGVLGAVVLTAAAVLLGTGFGALSNTVGMLVRRRETLIGLNSVLLLPLTFLSYAFMAERLMPGWIRAVAAYNPVNWALDIGRPALSGAAGWGVVLSRGGWLLAFAAVMVRLSVLTFRSYQKSV